MKTFISIPRDLPFRARYTFIGWATTSNGTASYYPGATINYTESITLYAVWSPINTQLIGTAVTGTGNVTATVTGAIVGDTYLNITTFELYQCTADNTWTYIGNIKGATGATGEKGDTGDTGADGKSISKTATILCYSLAIPSVIGCGLCLFTTLRKRP